MAYDIAFGIIIALGLVFFVPVMLAVAFAGVVELLSASEKLLAFFFNGLAFIVKLYLRLTPLLFILLFGLCFILPIQSIPNIAVWIVVVLITLMFQVSGLGGFRLAADWFLINWHPTFTLKQQGARKAKLLLWRQKKDLQTANKKEELSKKIARTANSALQRTGIKLQKRFRNYKALTVEYRDEALNIVLMSPCKEPLYRTSVRICLSPSSANGYTFEINLGADTHPRSLASTTKLYSVLKRVISQALVELETNKTLVELKEN